MNKINSWSTLFLIALCVAKVHSQDIVAETPSDQTNGFLSKSLAALLSNVVAASECDAQTNCQACGQMQECQWCQGEVSAKMAIGPEVDVAMFGKCTPKSDTCAVQFGEVANLLNMNVGALGSIKFSVGRSDGSACSTLQWPKEIATPTCADCVAQEGMGWCEGGLDIPLVPSTQGGFCIRESYGFMCNPTVVPVVKTFFGKLISARAAYVVDASQCGTGQGRPLKDSSPSCSENLSCTTCNESSSCTWCGMNAKVGIGIATVYAGFTGRCVDGANADCSNLNPGSFVDLIPAGSSLISQIAKDQHECNTVEWPALPWDHNTQESCLTQTGSGWCSIDVDSKNGGMCLVADHSWMCNKDLVSLASVTETVNMTWIPSQ